MQLASPASLQPHPVAPPISTALPSFFSAPPKRGQSSALVCTGRVRPAVWASHGLRGPVGLLQQWETGRPQEAGGAAAHAVMWADHSLAGICRPCSQGAWAQSSTNTIHQAMCSQHAGNCLPVWFCCCKLDQRPLPRLQHDACQDTPLALPGSCCSPLASPTLGCQGSWQNRSQTRQAQTRRRPT